MTSTTESRLLSLVSPVMMDSPSLKLKHQRLPSNEDHSATDESTARTSSLDTSAESDDSAETPAVEAPMSPATINMDTFHQILDLDEDETYGFSSSMIWAYFTQA
ncbi:hypothetical protein EDD85DRAFT_955319 [Armillaria nabsnona]|nr:hypothetical protein EDD85DRAFT_955319 [Armillaria nabsnona]